MIRFLEKECPHIWAILNQRAKQRPPKGFKEFLSGKWAAEGRVLLRQADLRIFGLIEKTSEQLVGDTYRRDISGVDSENRLAELLCEISLADALGAISSVAPILRPKIETGTECDVKVVVAGWVLYGESKRLEDTWKGGGRSIVKSPPESRPSDAARPRSMDLFSKLKDAHRQFPGNALTVLFLFHRSFGETSIYIRGALFGDVSAFDESTHPALYDDGLYALDEWQKISACAYSLVSHDGTLSIVKIWKNPRANVSLPDSICERLAGGSLTPRSSGR